jgi:hypothetical protein
MNIKKPSILLLALETVILAMMHSSLVPNLSTNLDSLKFINQFNQNLIVGLSFSIDENYELKNYYRYLENKTLIASIDSNVDNPSANIIRNVQAFYFQEIENITYDENSLFQPLNENKLSTINLIGNQIAISKTISDQYNIKKGDTRQVKLSRTSPTIDVRINHILEESHFLLQNTINQYHTFDKGEIGVVVYSKDIQIYESSATYIKFSVGAQSFNYAHGINAIRNSIEKELFSEIIVFLFLTLLIFEILFIHSSIHLYRLIKKDIHLIKYHHLFFEEIKQGLWYYLLMLGFISYFLIDLLIPSLVLIFSFNVISILVRKRIVLWTKVSE